MRGKTLCAAAAMAACLGLSAAARAEEKQIASNDREFIQEVTAGDMAEVKLGRLAMERAANPKVRELAEKIVDDHVRADKQLAMLLKNKALATPAKETPGGMKDSYDRLSKLRGADFDRAYLKEMVEDHRHDIPKFEAMAKNGKDADLRAFAIKTLPTLREHYEMALELAGYGKVR